MLRPGALILISPLGIAYKITASKEVILSAGAVGTPQLLLLSGIGSAAALSAKGIKTRLNSPNVGLNFAVGLTQTYL